MEYRNFLATLSESSESHKLIVVAEQCRSLRYRFAADVVMESWSKDLPIRHVVLEAENKDNWISVEALSLLQSNICLPFTWAGAMHDYALLDSFLDCIAAMSALVVARSRNIQGLQDFAKASVRREWKSLSTRGSLTKVLNEIGCYVAPARTDSFVARFSESTDLTSQKSINYLVAGLILLKDFVLLFSEKQKRQTSRSIALIDEALCFTGSHSNSDNFYSSIFSLSRRMDHSLILLSKKTPSYNFLKIVGSQSIVYRSISAAA